jgi:hypothetical protein
MSSFVAHSLCAEPPACTVKDGDDDTCEFLQGPVGVSIKRSGVDNHALVDADSTAHTKSKESAIGATNTNAKESEESEEKAVNHAKDIATAGSSSHATDSQAKIHSNVDEKGWPGDLWNKLTGILGNSLNLESALEQLKKEMDKFEKTVMSAMKDLKNDYKSMSLKDIQAKVAQILKTIHLEADMVALHIVKAAQTFKEGIAKALPVQFSKSVQAAFDKAAKTGKHFAASISDAETKIADANMIAICNHTEAGIKEIKKKADHFIKGATGLKLDSLKDSLKDLLAKLPSQVKDEIDKFTKEATEAGNKMVGNLPKAAQEIEEGIAAAFKDKCPNLAQSKATRSIGFSAVLIGAAYWLA